MTIGLDQLIMRNPDLYSGMVRLIPLNRVSTYSRSWIVYKYIHNQKQKPCAKISLGKLFIRVMILDTPFCKKFVPMSHENTIGKQKVQLRKKKIVSMTAVYF